MCKDQRVCRYPGSLWPSFQNSHANGNGASSEFENIPRFGTQDPKLRSIIITSRCSIRGKSVSQHEIFIKPWASSTEWPRQELLVTPSPMWTSTLHLWSNILALDMHGLTHQKQRNDLLDLLLGALSVFKTCPYHTLSDPVVARSLKTPHGKLWETLYLEAIQPVSHATFCLCFSSAVLLLP